MVEARCQSLFNSWLGEAGEIESCEVEPGLREVVMKVAMASCSQHQTWTASETPGRSKSRPCPPLAGIFQEQGCSRARPRVLAVAETQGPGRP